MISKVSSSLESLIPVSFKILNLDIHYFANKGPSSQGYGFSCGHVWM